MARRMIARQAEQQRLVRTRRKIAGEIRIPFRHRVTRERRREAPSACRHGRRHECAREREQRGVIGGQPRFRVDDNPARPAVAVAGDVDHTTVDQQAGVGRQRAKQLELLLDVQGTPGIPPVAARGEKGLRQHRREGRHGLQERLPVHVGELCGFIRVAAEADPERVQDRVIVGVARSLVLGDRRGKGCLVVGTRGRGIGCCARGFHDRFARDSMAAASPRQAGLPRMQ